MPSTIGFAEFITIFLLIFGLVLVIVGIFTVYFGSGKSRGIGGGLLCFGLLLGILWVYIVSFAKIFPLDGGLKNLIVNSALVLIAAILGAIAAIGLFLVVIMKS